MKNLFFCSLFAIAASTMSCSTNSCSNVAVAPNRDSVETVLHITYHTKPERTADFKKAFAACSLATMQEEGAIQYDLLQLYPDTTSFYLLERWKNKPAHLAHTKQPHLDVYFKAIDGAFDETKEGSFIEFYVLP